MVVVPLNVGATEFEDKACAALKTKEFTWVNNCFQSKRNAVIGLYGQRLFKIDIIHWIHRASVAPKFKMKMGPGGEFPRVADRSDHFPCSDKISLIFV